MLDYRYSLSACCSFLFALAVPLQATASLPYQARVVVDTATYRAGPGVQFYVCGPLSRGEIVEVYKRDDSGFLAIRPPRRASSWVLAREVAITDRADIGRVLHSGVTSWIDSQLPAAPDDQWQVRLKKDELVEILEKRSAPGQPQETADMYYRIVPPSGEFRWVEAQCVQPVQEGAGQPGNGQIQLAEYPQETTILSADGWRDRRLANVLPRPAPTIGRVSISKAYDAIPVTATTGDQHREKLAKFQRDVGAMLEAKYVPATFNRLYRQLERFHQLVPDQPLRENTRSLLDRLEAFQQSSLQDDPLEPSADAQGVRSGSRTMDRPANRVAGVEYDAVGWLMPVHGKTRSMPPFALLNDDGKLVQYVTPAPGVNLRRYARKNVGIFGKLRLHQNGQQRQLTAYRVIDLARHR